MLIHKDSHLDHALSAAHLSLLLSKFADRDAFFIETIELPDELESVPCGLFGPLMGDEPIGDADVELKPRGTRTWSSRLVGREPRMVRTLTIVAGPHDGHACVLFTAYGGPCAPKEPGEIKIRRQAAERARIEYRRAYEYTEEKGPVDLSAGFVELTEERDAIIVEHEASRAFWSKHALAGA